MISKLKAVLDDDRGVSPVIGVILMVAITVILAAVIGTFVLGLGDSLEQAPQAQLDAEYDSTNDEVDISHNGGDSIPEADLLVVVGSAEYDDDSGTGAGAFSISSGTEFSVGDTLTASETLSSDTQVQVIHEPSDSIILDTEVSV